MSTNEKVLKDEHGSTQSDINYVVSKPKGTDYYDGLLQILQIRLLFAF